MHNIWHDIIIWITFFLKHPVLYIVELGSNAALITDKYTSKVLVIARSKIMWHIIVKGHEMKKIEIANAYIPT